VQDGVRVLLVEAESKLTEPKSINLGPKRTFTVAESILWTKLCGVQFTAEVAATVSLEEVPKGFKKPAAVAKDAAAIRYGKKNPGFTAMPNERLKLTGAGQYDALPCVSNIINTTSKALATGGGDFLYYLNESRAMEQFASTMNLTLVKLPAT
jgi:hypothetical protein